MIPDISVIIPVYNAERYIKRCIESILAQTHNNLEVLLINDGSTDQSEKICKQYEIDKRVKVLSQPNEGVCSARNNGLKCARGKTITFVDADDWMPENGLKLLYDEMQTTDADLVVANMSFSENDKLTKIRVFDKPFFTDNRNWIDQYQLACIGYGYNPNPGTRMNITGLGSMGNKLYKREIIEKNHLRFDPYTLGIYEDNLFVLNYLEHTEKLSFIDDSVYYYRKVADSNSRGYKQNTLIINERIFQKIREFIEQNKRESGLNYYKALNIYVIRRLDVSLSAYFFADANKTEFLEKLRELKHLIHSEPYDTAIHNVEWRHLNPKNHLWTWITARTGSALLMFLGFKTHCLLRKIIIR